LISVNLKTHLKHIICDKLINFLTKNLKTSYTWTKNLKTSYTWTKNLQTSYTWTKNLKNKLYID